MIEITESTVESGLTSLVESAGAEFIYVQRPTADGWGCVYVHQGKPDCMIGQFLHGAGVPLKRLALADKVQGGAGTDARALVHDLVYEGVIAVSSGRIADVLSRAQGLQDTGFTWGEALEGALNALHEQG